MPTARHTAVLYKDSVGFRFWASFFYVNSHLPSSYRRGTVTDSPREDYPPLGTHPALQSVGIVQRLDRVLLCGHMTQEAAIFEIELTQFPKQVQRILVSADLIDGTAIRLARIRIPVSKNMRQ